MCTKYVCTSGKKKHLHSHPAFIQVQTYTANSAVLTFTGASSSPASHVTERRSFKAPPHKDATLIPVKLKLSSLGLNHPFIWHGLDLVCYFLSLFIFSTASPSFSQLSPRSNPQPLMPMSSFLPFSPRNDRILLLTQAAKHLNAKTQGSRHGLYLGIWPAHLNLKSDLYFRKVTRAHKGQSCML